MPVFERIAWILSAALVLVVIGLALSPIQTAPRTITVPVYSPVR